MHQETIFTKEEFKAETIETLTTTFKRNKKIVVDLDKDTSIVLIQLNNYYSPSGLKEIILFQKTRVDKKKWFSQGDEDGVTIEETIRMSPGVTIEETIRLSPLDPERAIKEFVKYFEVNCLEGKKYRIKSLTQEEEEEIRKTLILIEHI